MGKEGTRWPNYAAVSTWLQHCSKNHAKCRPLKSNSLKLMSFIDVDTNRIVPYRELPRKLPKTISDGIEVEKRLGEKYLWVDSICINQSVHAEKMAQIQILDTIYECAFATINAIYGKSANSGLPGLRADGTRIQQIYAEFGENIVVEKLYRLNDIAGASSWTSRA